MVTATITLKRRVWDTIEKRKDDVIKLCSNIITIPSDNPPGNTTQLATYLKSYLEDRKIEVNIQKPKIDNPNIVSTIEGSKDSPHLILNGHIDQFPAEVGEQWSADPYSGQVRDGKIYGRGAGDMKGGVTSLLFSFCLLNEMCLESLGKLTITLVSDEETGGKWGTSWLLDNIPDLLGDACLNSEPSGLTINVGEKGSGYFRLKSIGKPAHGSFAGYAGDNAIMKMIKVLPAVENLSNIRGRFTEETQKLIEEGMKGFDARRARAGAITPMSQVLKHVTVNIGVIKGGSKVNIVPGTCEADVGIRIPLGIAWKEIITGIEQELKKIEPPITYDYIKDPKMMFPANYSSTKTKIVKLLYENAREVTGTNPLISFGSGASDCRFFRAKNIPSAEYGPVGYNIARADENITVNDLIEVTKVNAGTIIDFFNQ
jgi:succinyl-diaminopimelate desuccinylase